MKNEKSVISNVVKNDLCLSCGLCVSICPYHVLEMAPSGHRLMPFYKNHDCANCGKCLETCPSWSINIKDMLSARDMNPQTPAPRGNEIDSYIYQTKSPDILKKSSSGGAVTQIIKLALESKLFEKAFTFKSMSLSGANFLEETALSELSESQGSKYILPSLQKLIAYLDTTKNPNAIIVSTPCNLHGILKYCKIKNIKTNNLLFVGLFCDMAMSENAISYFTNKYSGRKNIVAFDFRSKDEKGWPGTPKITYEDNSTSFPPRYERIRLKPFCRIRRCLYCIDKLNMFADISCGDCYIGGLTDQLGNSNIIVRTPKGKELLAKISLDRSGTLNKVPIEQILDSQKLYSKMENYSNSLILSKKLKHNIYDDFPRLAYVKNSRNKKSIRTKNRYISFGKLFADKYMIIDLYYKIYTHMKRAVNRIRKEKPKSQKKHIMILGGGFDNKGAESMIRTAVYLARKKFPDHEPVVIHSPFNSSS